MPGPAPKPPAQRRRRNADPVARKKLTQPPASHPALPRAEFYGPSTLRWYETWATSPQASRFLATDWQRLHMLAELVEAYFAEPTKDLMGEIRLNEAMLGATEADRLRLRWDIEPQATPERPKAAPKPNRKANVMRLIDGGKAS